MVIFLIIVLFSVLILGHELGHFLTARKIGAKVEEFGFGLPPRVFGVWKEGGRWHHKWGGDSESEEEGEEKRENTIYSINLLPIGGFVKIFGEEGKHKNDPNSFAAQSIGERAMMLTGGVLMNLVLAAIFLSIVSFAGSPQLISSENQNFFYGAKVSEQKIQVLSVASDTPASEAGVKAGDVIKKMVRGSTEATIESVGDVQTFSESYAGMEVSFVLERNGEKVQKKLVPRQDPPEAEGAMGIALGKTAVVSYPWYIAPIQGVVAAGRMIWMMVGMLGYLLKSLILKGEMVGQVAGPVGIVK
ncbi:MAG TPA: site-2 protease family protein, partial [Patescibacteria group bacterium]|nr:site-2 protease family protein [Patescibacteria group bacterium]